MAKLYMKQKIFSWKDRFTIKDQNDSDRYTVEGELISIGKKLHVYDMNNNEVAFVQQKVLTLLLRLLLLARRPAGAGPAPGNRRMKVLLN